jgi:hypothetical protein
MGLDQVPEEDIRQIRSLPIHNLLKDQPFGDLTPYFDFVKVIKGEMKRFPTPRIARTDSGPLWNFCASVFANGDALDWTLLPSSRFRFRGSELDNPRRIGLACPLVGQKRVFCRPQKTNILPLPRKNLDTLELDFLQINGNPALVLGFAGGQRFPLAPVMIQAPLGLNQLILPMRNGR